MGRASYVSKGSLAKAKLILEGLDSLTTSTNIFKRVITLHDQKRINDIRDHIQDLGCITPRQYRSMLHYSKVYDIKILQSLDFILD